MKKWFRLIVSVSDMIDEVSTDTVSPMRALAAQSGGAGEEFDIRLHIAVKITFCFI